MFSKIKKNFSANIIFAAFFLVLAPAVLVTASSRSNQPAFGHAELQAKYSGVAQIEGNLAFNARLNPSVVKVGGSMTLQLTVQNNSADAVSPSIRIRYPATLSIDAQNLPSGTSLNLQNSEMVWSPVLNGQGGVSEGAYTFSVDGVDTESPEQTISFEVSHDGIVQTAEVLFWSGAVPTGTFSMSPVRASVGQPVQLSAEVSGNGPINQAWLLSDGRQILAENPVVVFPEVGTHPVTLFLTNPAGTTAIEQFITIVPEPAAFISLSDSAPAVSEAVQFLSNGGGQQPLSYYWDFGDGTFSTDPNPIHQYPVAGSYTVVYTVNNEFGSAQNFVEISVGNPPAADAVLPADGEAGQAILAQAIIDGAIESVRWDMGDGTQLEGIDISHIYKSSGVYTIQMDAISPFGTASIARIVTISGGRTEIYLPLILNEMLSDAVTADVDSENVASSGGENLLTSTLVDIENSTEIVLIDNPDIAGADLAAQLYWYINEARRQGGLDSVSLVPSLSVAAKQHTNDMAAFKYTGHTGSDGTHPYERLARVGFREGGYAGETTAWGFRTPREAVDFWLNSPPHRAILLNPIANQVGVAQTTNYNAPNVWYWTAEFASTLGSIEDQMLEAGIRTNGYIPNQPNAEDTIIFYWYWPLPLANNQTFSLYSLQDEFERKIGSIRVPISDEKPFDFGYPVQGVDLIDRAGSAEWFVRLETFSGEEQTQSDLSVVTVLGDWPTPTAAPTLTPTVAPAETATVVVPVPVIVTSTPLPAATPTPLGQTGGVLPTAVATATAVQLPTAAVTALPTVEPQPTATSTSVPVVQPAATNTPLAVAPSPTTAPTLAPPQPTATSVPPTLAPTNTSVPPPPTNTPVPPPPPTNTPVPPPPNTPTPELIAVTNTPVPPAPTQSKYPATSTPAP